MRFITIDIQGLYHNDDKNGNIEPKEITIYEKNRCEHFLIKPTKLFSELSPSEKRQVHYLEKFHHGIKYYTGNTRLSDVVLTIKDLIVKFDINRIYVRGHQKYNFLKVLLKNVPGLEIVNVEQHTPRFNMDRPSCFSHSLLHCMCSKNNAKFLYNYLCSLLPM